MDINRDNYETFFLLHLDRELKPAEIQAVEKFLSENTDLQKEFEILQQTVLVPEDMIFEQKETLFRKEEKRKIIPFYRMRVAAAVAIMILGGWLITTQVINNRARMTAVNNPTDKLINTMEPVAEKSKTTDNKKEPAVNSNTEDNSAGVEKNNNPGSQTNTDLNKNDLKQNPRGNSVLTDNKNDLTANSKQDEGKELTVRDQRNQISNEVTDEGKTAVQKNSTGLELQMEESGKGTKQIAAAPGEQAPALLIASLNSKDVHEENVLMEPDFQSDNAISVIALNEKNKAITGFFKKLTKRAPADENARKVRVSVFQFSY
jgi:hypothetical protein